MAVVRCPSCGCGDTRVLDSRPAQEGASIRRRRECPRCRRRFTTYERMEERPLLVIKKDGRREPFDRDKILRGLLTACEKRPIGLGQLESLVAGLEDALRADGTDEVQSAWIGEKVMEALERLDAVAYIRFASVYRQFTDLSRFREELERLRRRSADDPPEDTEDGH